MDDTDDLRSTRRIRTVRAGTRRFVVVVVHDVDPGPRDDLDDLDACDEAPPGWARPEHR